MKRYGPGPHKRRTRKLPDPEWDAFLSDDEREAIRIAEIKTSSLANLGIGSRTVNCLEDYNILLIGELSVLTRDELLSIENFGEQTIAECGRLLDSLKIPHPQWKRFSKRKSRNKPKK